jgi:hypothetical protein
MTDGKACDIRHPQMHMISRTVIAVAEAKPRARSPEGIVLFDSAHVIRIEPLDGDRSRRRG